MPDLIVPQIRFCTLCHAEWRGHHSDRCPRCSGNDHMAVSCTAAEANEREAAWRALWRREQA